MLCVIEVSCTQMFLSFETLWLCRPSMLPRYGGTESVRAKMSRFLNVLRSWLVMVSVIAMGNTVQSFRDHSFLSEKLYTGTPEFVNGLQARTFGIWTLLSSIIRCVCAIDIHNKTLYHITLWTFVLALGHFLSEAFIYKTAPLTIGVMAPLIVASVSVLGMLIGFQCIGEPQEVMGVRQKKRN
ncbi:ergosterol biosynthetic protein 28 homolog isoform X1 [Anguilla rostrata]|uniref:ergosterol biosynthetic protein 28 homolog isoform X1 n=2 Tax=Anguilla rostrata TaxID=7938 RepID=UPI0030D05793